jgi:hypothetical protein
MMQASRVHRRTLFASLAVVASSAVIAVPATASGEPAPKEPFIRSVEPVDPTNPPTAPPEVDLTAACVRSVPGDQLREAVFGYDNPGTNSILVSLDADSGQDRDANVIVRTTGSGQPPQIEELGPQVTLMKPGSHPYAFSVLFAPGEQVAWRVLIPSQNETGEWSVTVRPRLDVACPSKVPVHFAVVQDVRILPDRVIRAVRPPFPLEIVAYDVEFQVVANRVACSAGGHPVLVQKFVGWQQGMNVEPAKAAYRVRVIHNGGRVVYDMLPANDPTEDSRPVADVSQPVTWLGPIADVTAVCAFGDETVASDVFWAQLDGFGQILPVITEDGRVIDLDFSQNSPVGSRLR